MKFLCIPCDEKMETQVDGIMPEEKKNLVMKFKCKKCGHSIAMLTNKFETEFVSIAIEWPHFLHLNFIAKFFFSSGIIPSTCVSIFSSQGIQRNFITPPNERFVKRITASKFAYE